MMTSKKPKRPPASSPPWLSLPDHLMTDQILHRLPLSDYIRFAAVCSRWRSLQTSHRLLHFPRPPPTLPIPFLFPARHDLPHSPATCFTPFEPNHRHYRFHLPEHETLYALAHNHGWLLLSYTDFLNPWAQMSHLCLFNPVSGARFLIPRPGKANLRYAVSSSPSRDPGSCCVLGIDGMLSRCEFYRLGHDSWDSLPLPLPLPVPVPEDRHQLISSPDRILTRPVFSDTRGKFFCVVEGHRSRAGLLVVDVFAAAGPTAEFLDMSGARAGLGPEWRRQFNFLECDGELMLVVARKTYVDLEDGSRHKVVVDVGLFRADLGRREWVAVVGSIGEERLVIVAGESACLVRAADVGMRGNAVLIGSDILVEEPEECVPWGLFEIDTKVVRRVTGPLSTAWLYDSYTCFVPTLC